MKRIAVIATSRARFARPGQRRTMRPQEAKVLVTLGQATYAASAETPAPTPRASKRQYQRRDMTAQPASAPAFAASSTDSSFDDGEAS